MLRRIFRVLLYGLLTVFAGVIILYFFGLRIVLDGGGGVRLGFIRTADQQADIVARHREAQRLSPTPPPAGAPVADPAGPPVPPSGSTVPSDLTSRAGVGRAMAANPPFYWTDFRGPGRDGHYMLHPIRTDWPASGLQPMWKQPAGGGYASFVSARNRAFTIEQRGPREVVAAYDVITGRELWTQGWDAVFRELMGGDGPRATPTWFDNRVYALGATGELACLDDETGRVIWRKNILDDNGADNLQWGMAGSPLIVDETVVVHPGGPNGRSVVAYHHRSGDRVWSALDDRASYSSPMLVTLGGVRQLIVFSAVRLMGLTPDRGRVLWEYPWVTSPDVNASQPIVIGENRVFVSTGYGKGAAVIELTPAANGFTVREVWRNIRMKNQFTSSVLHNGFIYGLDENILACVDAATGELKWKGGRYGYGQIMLASDHVIVLTESGELALVRAIPDRHQELVRFPAIEGKTWNHPAIVDGILLIRNLQEMAAFDLR